MEMIELTRNSPIRTIVELTAGLNLTQFLAMYEAPTSAGQLNVHPAPRVVESEETRIGV
jgi:hypothetical protein